MACKKILEPETEFVSFLTKGPEGKMYKISVFVPKDAAEEVKEAMFAAGARSAGYPWPSLARSG